MIRSAGEVAAFSRREVENAGRYADCFGVYRPRCMVSKLEIPQEIEDHPYFESHELTPPMQETITKRTALASNGASCTTRGRMLTRCATGSNLRKI